MPFFLQNFDNTCHGVYVQHVLVLLASAESRNSAIISLFLSLFSYLITCIEKVVVCGPMKCLLQDIWQSGGCFQHSQKSHGYFKTERHMSYLHLKTSSQQIIVINTSGHYHRKCPCNFPLISCHFQVLHKLTMVAQ